MLITVERARTQDDHDAGVERRVDAGEPVSGDLLQPGSQDQFVPREVGIGRDDVDVQAHPPSARVRSDDQLTVRGVAGLRDDVEQPRIAVVDDQGDPGAPTDQDRRGRGPDLGHEVGGSS
jgi:hypothetical protein